MDVGKRIRELREMRGFTVNRLANMAGISQSYLRDVELGNKNPTVETLSYFCDALNISLAEFFAETSDDINPMLKTSLSKLTDEQQIKLSECINSILMNSLS